VAEAAGSAAAILLGNQPIVHATLLNLSVPRIKADCSHEWLNVLQTKWRNLKNASAIPEDKLNTYLMSVCAKDLKEDIRRANPRITDNNEAEVIAEIKPHAVLNKAKYAQISELLQTRQEDCKGV
jgi:hypothetical protein